MKTLKTNQKIKLVLAILIVLIIGITIVGKLSNNRVQANTDTCEHEYEVKSDETNHWEECTKCNEIKEGSTEAHTYVDEVCSVCGVEKPTETCEHEYEVKSDETNHWEECTKCNEIKEGSTQAHTYVDGVCSVCGAKKDSDSATDDDNNDNNQNDNTVADKDIPYTGTKNIAIAIIFLISIIGIMSAIKMKKYKNI